MKGALVAMLVASSAGAECLELSDDLHFCPQDTWQDSRVIEGGITDWPLPLRLVSGVEGTMQLQVAVDPSFYLGLQQSLAERVVPGRVARVASLTTYARDVRARKVEITAPFGGTAPVDTLAFVAGPDEYWPVEVAGMVTLWDLHDGQMRITVFMPGDTVTEALRAAHLAALNAIRESPQ